jgi:hypothetical protein
MKTRSNKCARCGCNYASKTHQTRCAGKTVRQFRATNRARAAHSRTSTAPTHSFGFSAPPAGRIIANSDYFAANNAAIEAKAVQS